MAWRRERLGVALALCALVAVPCLSGCELNPQPEVPEGDEPGYQSGGPDGGASASQPEAGSPLDDDRSTEANDPGEYDSPEANDGAKFGAGTVTPPERPDAGTDENDMDRDAGLGSPPILTY